MKNTSNKIQAMTEGGAKLGRVLVELLDIAQPGVSLLTIEEATQKKDKIRWRHSLIHDRPRIQMGHMFMRK